MALVKFNCDGRMSDNGKSGMPQFDHAKGETLDVSADCAQSAVGYGMASHVVQKAESNPATKDKANADATLTSMKVPELKELAKTLGIEGADSLNKADLVTAIAAAKAATANDQE